MSAIESLRRSADSVELSNDNVMLVDVTGLIFYFSIALVIMRGVML